MTRCLLLFLVGCAAAVQPAPPRRELRVCADPNNLPFSNRREEGYENAIARIVAAELGARLEFVWWAQRRGFVRNTLGANACDLWMEVPARFDPVLATRPYFRSTYVFVTRPELELRSLDDPRLGALKIGVQLIGKDLSDSPPAHALADRGLSANVRGYPVYGDYAQDVPLQPIIDAVRSGEVDAAIVWGPLAGYFARDGSLRVRPVPQEGTLPFAFDIAVGVRKDARELRDEVQRALDARRNEIVAVLDRFGVPRLEDRP
jgi:mxaJ protein